MNAQTPRNSLPPHSRLNEMKSAHLAKVLSRLSVTINPLPAGVTFSDSDAPARLADLLMTHYTPQQIDAAHAQVVASYNSRSPYRRGRPKGSQNTNTTTDATDNTNTTTDATELARLITTAVTQALMSYTQRNDATTEALTKDVLDLHAQVKTLRANVADLTEQVKTSRPTLVEIPRVNLPPIKLGAQHASFPTLLKMCAARQRSGYALNVWVHGPAGTGKSTAAENVAKALDLPFYTTGSLEAKHEVLGYCDAQGRYVSTQFREAWEKGGIYCLDEVDGSSPQAMLALNGALAGSLCAFADKLVKRHKDCIIIATANTTGQGASVEYSGRYKMDSASLDRFVTLHWPIDEALEASMCGNVSWLTRVRQVRANLALKGIKGVAITPRAVLAGESLLAAGLSMVDVEQSVLKKGMTDAQWTMVK